MPPTLIGTAFVLPLLVLLWARHLIVRRLARELAADQAEAYERAWAAVLPDLTVTLNGKPATAATLAALKHLNSPAERKD